MKCPSCNKPLRPDVPECPECGFSLKDLATRFGTIPRYNALLTDTTGGALKASQFKKVSKNLEFFDKRFPQMRFSAFIHRLPASVPIKEYVFYLHNTCRFMPYDRYDLNASILLFIDSHGKQACLMTGYGLEDLLSEEELDNILAKATPHFKNNRLANAIISCVQQTMTVLQPKINQKSKPDASSKPDAAPKAANSLEFGKKKETKQ